MYWTSWSVLGGVKVSLGRNARGMTEFARRTSALQRQFQLDSFLNMTILQLSACLRSIASDCRQAGTQSGEGRAEAYRRRIVQDLAPRLVSTGDLREQHRNLRIPSTILLNA